MLTPPTSTPSTSASSIPVPDDDKAAAALLVDAYGKIVGEIGKFIVGPA